MKEMDVTLPAIDPKTTQMLIDKIFSETKADAETLVDSMFKEGFKAGVKCAVVIVERELRKASCP